MSSSSVAKTKSHVKLQFSLLITEQYSVLGFRSSVSHSISSDVLLKYHKNINASPQEGFMYKNIPVSFYIVNYLFQQKENLIFLVAFEATRELTSNYPNFLMMSSSPWGFLLSHLMIWMSAVLVSLLFNPFSFP